MKHIFIEGKDSQNTLLLLHGTGGTERDLLPIAEMIDPEANILAVRGNILENGMPRFFKRLSEGVFDQADLIKQTKTLNTFLNEASVQYQFDRQNIVAVGYSNGANIAASLLFHYSKPLRAAILHHPMVPRRDIKLPDQTGLPVFIGAGKNDPLCPQRESVELAHLLLGSGAKVSLHWEMNGHQLSRTEIMAAHEWYQTHIK
ncbi:alpha/beta hydrolase [Amphibacillus sediminis]|uniref:alpha/beta hydrolase n=1 Tax=Amphibacillus sediminis TaxID=360185 RepID=UPI0008310F63|nr:alpha/beta hydrolase [Amphibacillus sediminis]